MTIAIESTGCTRLDLQLTVSWQMGSSCCQERPDIPQLRGASGSCFVYVDSHALTVDMQWVSGGCSFRTPDQGPECGHAETEWDRGGPVFMEDASEGVVY